MLSDCQNLNRLRDIVVADKDEGKTFTAMFRAGVILRMRRELQPAWSLTQGHTLICQITPFLANVNSRSRSLYAIARPSVVCLSSVVCL